MGDPVFPSSAPLAPGTMGCPWTTTASPLGTLSPQHGVSHPWGHCLETSLFQTKAGGDSPCVHPNSGGTLCILLCCQLHWDGSSPHWEMPKGAKCITRGGCKLNSRWSRSRGGKNTTDTSTFLGEGLQPLQSISSRSKGRREAKKSHQKERKRHTGEC